MSSDFGLRMYKKVQSLKNPTKEDKSGLKLKFVTYRWNTTKTTIELRIPEGFKEEKTLKASTSNSINFSQDQDKVHMNFKIETESYFKKYIKDQLAGEMIQPLKYDNTNKDKNTEVVTYRTISAIMNIYNFICFKKISKADIFGILTCPNSDSDDWIPVFEEVVSSIKAVS